ncbi:MAG: 4Fe-4S binding protein [Dehalococcoidia bacterium]|nr:MAG: 4Fe-4S binding protein [Dehalococcoidia bacterium]
MVRKIVFIDEGRCNGCGLCIPACAEGALQVINGKAKLVGDIYCDGLGACIGHCPNGAIEIGEREAEQFDEVAATIHLKRAGQETGSSALSSSGIYSNTKGLVSEPNSCPAMKQSIRNLPNRRQWPIQLALVSPEASFLKQADILLVADCVPFCYENFHRDFLKENILLVSCPKLDDFQSQLYRLTDIVKKSGVKSIKVIHMDIPCCSGLMYMAKQAISKSGKDVLLEEVTITSN